MKLAACCTKVLIFRPDNIGDVVLFSGALKYFRKIFLGAEITLAVKQHVVELVEQCPHVDRVEAVEDLASPGNNGAMLSRLGQKFRRFVCPGESCYDLVLYPVRAPQPVHLALLKKIAARRRFGIVGCEINAAGGYPKGLEPEKIFDDYLDINGRNPWEHEFEIMQLLLARFGQNFSGCEQLSPEFWFAPEDCGLVLAMPERRQVLGLFPFASGSERRWPLDRYLPLLRQLPGVRSVVLLGGKNDVAAGMKLSAELAEGLTNVDVVNLVGQTTLRQLVLTIAACSVLVSVDSCGLHMGLATGVPTVGIVAGGHYGMFIPWGDPQRSVILTHRLACFNCNWKCCRKTFECIDGVTPEEVAAAIERLTAGAKERH